MRITTGSKKRYAIKVPPSAVRPTKDMVRQAIFSMLGPEIKNRTIADLFAGSGALGLEALSRGAAHCDFVDSNETAIQTIEENLAAMDFSSQAATHHLPVLDFCSLTPAPHYEIILADPPYDYQRPEKLIEKISHLLLPGGLLVLEQDRKSQIINEQLGEMTLIEERTYGKTRITFWQKQLQN